MCSIFPCANLDIVAHSEYSTRVRPRCFVSALFLLFSSIFTALFIFKRTEKKYGTLKPHRRRRKNNWWIAFGWFCAALKNCLFWSNYSLDAHFSQSFFFLFSFFFIFVGTLNISGGWRGKHENAYKISYELIIADTRDWYRACVFNRRWHIEQNVTIFVSFYFLFSIEEIYFVYFTISPCC